MRFLIICKCGHRFWRSHPCAPNLRTWECPRHRRNTRHETRCATATEQMRFVWYWQCPQCARCYRRDDLPNECECGKRPALSEAREPMRA